MIASEHSSAGPRFFRWVVTHRVAVCAASLLALVCLAVALPSLTQDTRADAYLSPDNDALVYRERIKSQFGLSDPFVIAVVDEGENGIFTPANLLLIDELSVKVSDLPNINSDRVASLASEKNIESSAGEIDISHFYTADIAQQSEADGVREAVASFPLLMGNLVSNDGKLALIVAEMEDESLGEETYFALLELVGSIATPENVEVHVAGEGAISAFLGRYMETDARRLNPFAGLLIMLIVLLAFGRISTMLLSAGIIAATLVCTFGIMAMAGIPVYIITNALPVILIGIAVADSIHIFTDYLEKLAQEPAAEKKEVVVRTMADMWLPISLTSLTTVCGFVGLYLAAYMPPFKYFGLYAAIGVTAAWIYSLTFLPAALAIIQPQARQTAINLKRARRHSPLSGLMIRVGTIPYEHPKTVMILAGAYALLGLYAISELRVEEDRIAIFQPEEPIRMADTVINRHGNGTGRLDVVVETDEHEGLLKVDKLEKIERLQDYLQKLPHVTGSVSVVDYLKQLNKAFNEGDPAYYRLPEDDDTVAQYLLVYSAISDPADFEEELDYEYRSGLIQVSMNSGTFSDISQVITRTEPFLADYFSEDSLRATLSGRATLTYHWVKDLADSHFLGMLVALSLVYAVSALLFSSWVAGGFALLPVVFSLFSVYLSMMLWRVDLGVGSSMFAAVSIGLGIDFSIHTLERFKKLCGSYGQDYESALKVFYTTTGRALFFNFSAISCGFGVLLSSTISSLVAFGGIVVFSVVTSFLASILLLPALIYLAKPDFIFAASKTK